MDEAVLDSLLTNSLSERSDEENETETKDKIIELKTEFKIHVYI